MVVCGVVRRVGFAHICCAVVFCCAWGAPDSEGNSLLQCQRDLAGAALSRGEAHSRLRGVCGCELPMACAKLEAGVPLGRDCAAGRPGAPPAGPPKAPVPH